MQTPQQFDQVVRRDRQVDVRWAVLRLPADVFEQAEVFADLDPQALGLNEVLLLDRDPEVAYSAEVVENELVERVPTLPVDRRGGFARHGVPFRSGRRREAQDAVRLPPGAGTVSSASKLVLRCRGPGAFVASPGPLLVLSAANVGGRDARLKACRRTSLGPHVAPGVAPWRFSAVPRKHRKPRKPAPEAGFSERA